jgi:hypothetical protein
MFCAWVCTDRNTLESALHAESKQPTLTVGATYMRFAGRTQCQLLLTCQGYCGCCSTWIIIQSLANQPDTVRHIIGLLQSQPVLLLHGDNDAAHSHAAHAD